MKQAVQELQDKSHEVDLAGVFYHVGENEMSMPPYRKNAPKWLQSTLTKSRQDLGLPTLEWYVSQQPPTNHERVNSIDVTSELERIAAADKYVIHIKAFDLPKQEKNLVIDTAGIVRLGELIADSYLELR